jgi:hypothetical protein
MWNEGKDRNKRYKEGGRNQIGKQRNKQARRKGNSKEIRKGRYQI